MRPPTAYADTSEHGKEGLWNGLAGHHTDGQARAVERCGVITVDHEWLLLHDHLQFFESLDSTHKADAYLVEGEDRGILQVVVKERQIAVADAVDKGSRGRRIVQSLRLQGEYRVSLRIVLPLENRNERIRVRLTLKRFRRLQIRNGNFTDTSLLAVIDNCILFVGRETAHNSGFLLILRE